MKFHFVSTIPYYFIEQCFSDSKPIFSHKAGEHTSGTAPPPVSGGERLTPADSLQLQHLSEGEYQQALGPGRKYMQEHTYASTYTADRCNTCIRTTFAFLENKFA